VNVLIVLAHPEANSFNAELVRRAKEVFLSQGHSVRISDLYAGQFDPCERGSHFPQRRIPERFYAQTEQRFNSDQGTLPADVEREIDAILWADFVLFQFPLWWFGMPAILKGWMDRVFVYGSLYTGSRRFNNGVCRGKRAVLSVTAGSPEEACMHDGREGDTRLILWPIHYALHYVGFTVLDPIILTSIGEAHGDSDRAAHDRLHTAQLDCHGERLLHLETRPIIQFNAEDDWDERRKLKTGAPVYSPFIRHCSEWQHGE
jgi:NAD(P)H dehydrogenase (quinone)